MLPHLVIDSDSTYIYLNENLQDYIFKIKYIDKGQKLTISITAAQSTGASGVDVSKHVPFDPRNGMMVNWRESTQMFLWDLQH